MILKVIFQPDERSMKGVWIVLLGGVHACCGHTDSSPKVMWLSGSCLALSSNAGVMLVTPKCCSLSQGCLQGSSLEPIRATAATAAMCFNPRMGHGCVLMDSVESAPPDFLLCCKVILDIGDILS